MMPPWMEEFLPLEPPAPVAWWPPAPGWWLLLISVLLLLAIGWHKWQRRQKREAYRRTLQMALEQLWEHHRPDLEPSRVGLYFSDCCTVLRRTWRLWSPSHAALPSRQLLEALELTPGIQLPGQVIASAERLLYDRGDTQWQDGAVVIKEFHDQLLRWSQTHQRTSPC